MGGKSADTPPAPDYTAAAIATGESSAENLAAQTAANRPDQYTPWGSTTWDSAPVWDPASNQYVTKWTHDTQVSPEAQRAVDAQIGLEMGRSELGESMMGRGEDAFGQPMDWNSFTPSAETPQYAGTGRLEQEMFQSFDDNRQGVDQIRNNAEDAIYNRATSRLDPQWDQQGGDLEAKLVAQGLRPGDPAYQREMENFGRAKTDAYDQAQYGAIMGGGEEAQRQYGMQSDRYGQDLNAALSTQGYNSNLTNQMYNANQAYNQQDFGNAMSSANYQNALRQQDIAEGGQERMWALNEMNALLSGQQVQSPNAPAFNSSGVAAPVNFSQAANQQYSGALDAYSADQGASNSFMSGLASLAGTGASAYMMG